MPHKKPGRGERTKSNREHRRDDVEAAYNDAMPKVRGPKKKASKMVVQRGPRKKKKASGSKSTVGSAIGSASA